MLDAAFLPTETELILKSRCVAKASGLEFQKSIVRRLQEYDRDICNPAEEDGEIGLDEEFSAGEDAPPFHPNCECKADIHSHCEGGRSRGGMQDRGALPSHSRASPRRAHAYL